MHTNDPRDLSEPFDKAFRQGSVSQKLVNAVKSPAEVANEILFDEPKVSLTPEEIIQQDKLAAVMSERVKPGARKRAAFRSMMRETINDEVNRSGRAFKACGKPSKLRRRALRKRLRAEAI